MGNFEVNAMRKCDTTGLPVCLTAQRYIKLNGVFAVIFLLIGTIASILLAMTRTPAIHLLSQTWYYRILTVHGMNMLIFWMLFAEVAILYFCATTLLNSRLYSKGMAFVGFAMMLVGAIVVDIFIFMGKADVLMTSYPPLRAHAAFYLGIILVAVGTLIGVVNFFGTIYIAKRDKTYDGSVPLVVFGAIAAAIIAVVTLLHGAAVMIPTFAWAMDWVSQPDPAWYRLVWWGLGHQSQ